MTLRSSHLARRGAAALALVVSAGLALGGCGAINPRLANPNYAASDGVALNMSGQVTGENLLIVSGGQHEPGQLLGALTNRGTSRVTVTIGIDGAAKPIATESVAPGETLLLGSEEGRELLVPFVPAAPGGTQLVTFASDALGATQVPVPVLDGTFPEYATLVPTATPATAQPA